MALFETCAEARMASVAFDAAFFIDVEMCDTVKICDRVFDLGECVGVL